MFLSLLPQTTEAVVRGHKAGLLRQNDYHNLFQCETLDDLKLNLVRRRRGKEDEENLRFFDRRSGCLSRFLDLDLDLDLSLHPLSPPLSLTHARAHTQNAHTQTQN
jgi:hypothetical protein